MRFLKVAAAFFLTSTILGLLCGLLYSNGVIGKTGIWVDVLNCVTRITLDKTSFAFEFFGALYLAGWAYLSKLATVQTWSKWVLIKCCLGLTVVPVFVVVASYFIPPLASALGPALYVSIMGYALGYAWNIFLTEGTNPKYVAQPGNRADLREKPHRPLTSTLCLKGEPEIIDGLMEELDLAKNGEAPSPFGKAEFMLKGSPASVQSKKDVRDAYIQSIKDQFKYIKYLLTGQLILDVTWFLPAKSRFETDAKADIDNCIKPIIDAFTGPDGFFIDDCQINGLYICWRHAESEDERLVFKFEFQADQYLLKEQLAFVQLDGSLCTPVNLNWPVEAKKLWAEMLKTNQSAKTILEKLGAPYPAVAAFLGGSQPFHRTRVTGFTVKTLNNFVSQREASELA